MHELRRTYFENSYLPMVEKIEIAHTSKEINLEQALELTKKLSGSLIEYDQHFEDVCNKIAKILDKELEQIRQERNRYEFHQANDQRITIPEDKAPGCSLL